MVEGDNSYFAHFCPVCHVINLGVDGSFNTLDTRNIGQVSIGSIQELIRTVTILTHLVDQLREMVAFDVVSTLDGLGHAHRSGRIDTKDHRYILASHRAVLHLS